MKQTISIGLFISVLLFTNSTFAWNDKVTHRDLSQYAAENSVLDKNKGDYLSNLGVKGGLDESFKWEGKELSAKFWIREGALQEDAGTNFQGFTGQARYLNHFHNPLKPWADAGLSGVYNGKSSVLWAQDAATQAGWLGGDWSWPTTRLRYYKALTSFTDTERQAYFAQTFRGLGQQIHLIQDKAQPAHVRNDAHPADDSGKIPGFEFWAKRPDNEPIVKPLMANPIFPTIDSPITISRFYDTDQYDGTNPSTSLTLGLAEYTNANFASEDTITSFPYPRLTDMQYYEEPAGTWGSFYKYRKYYRKTGGGEKIEHFANAGRLTKYLNTYTVLQTSTLGLDDKVYNDYAQKLLPRAVGYSAGLLNYFFRGQMYMYEDPQVPGTFIIENKTDEIMNGIFRLFYDDDQGNYRTEISGTANWSLEGQNVTLDPSGDKSKVTGVKFTPPSPAPKGDNYLLVFYGKIGNEEGVPVGKIVPLRRTQSFKIKLTRADNVTVTPQTANWTEIIIYDSQNNWAGDGYQDGNNSYNLWHDDKTGYWEVKLEPSYTPPAGNKGFWIDYYTDKSIFTQYPGRYKSLDKRNDADLIQPGTYEDNIPLWDDSRPMEEEWTDTTYLAKGFIRSSVPYKTYYSVVPEIFPSWGNEGCLTGMYASDDDGASWGSAVVTCSEGVFSTQAKWPILGDPITPAETYFGNVHQPTLTEESYSMTAVWSGGEWAGYPFCSMHNLVEHMYYDGYQWRYANFQRGFQAGSTVGIYFHYEWD